VVASAIVNGTLRKRASVCASSVLPVPVGPMSRMFDFCELDIRRTAPGVSMRL
jgi:hypothetical protein